MPINTIPRTYLTCTIASGATESNAIDLTGNYLAGLHFPAMTGSAVTLVASTTIDGVYTPVFNNANVAISFTVDGNARTRLIEPSLVAGLQFVKLVAGTAQAAQRVITAIGVR